jgi:hypothetical protein
MIIIMKNMSTKASELVEQLNALKRKIWADVAVEL